MGKHPFGHAVVVLLLAALSGTCRGGADEPVGTVKGTVLVTGEPPTPREWALDEAIQRVTGEKIYREETWLVGKNKGLAHCVVTLKAKDPARRVAPRPLENVVLDKVGVRYVPRVLVVTPNTTVVLRNKSSPCRGFQIVGNSAHDHNFNYMIQEGREQKVIFRGRDTCSITCPTRPYTKGYIRVVDTPYFAVTDSEGRFVLPSVPAGEYQVAVWHEGAGTLTKDAGPTAVMVAPGGEQRLTFRVKISGNKDK